MEEIIPNKSGETMTGLKGITEKSCAAAVSPVPIQKQKQKAILGIQNVEENIMSPTPEKTSEASFFMRKKKDEGKLPYEDTIMLDFFNSMTCSLRLLRLCGKSPTFQNISSQVQTLTGRKFDYRHLEQIKHVLPEVIHIKKILVHDTRSMCMKPDMMISLLFDIVEGHDEQSDYIALSRIYALRLSKNSTIRFQVCDIDQAEVPDSSSRGIIATNIQENTPIKSLVDNCAGLMFETPAQSTPKRSLHTYTCEGKDKTEVQKIATPGSPTAKRSLPFSSVVDEGSFCNSTIFEVAEEHDSKTNTSDSDGMGVMENILNEKTCPSASNICKEDEKKLNSDKVLERNESNLAATYDQPPAVSLSDLILTIHRVFQSVNWRSITKQELVHKIVMDNCDIDENSDIVENIEHLEKLLPDWISSSRESTPSGDLLLYSIRKVSDLNCIKDRLAGGHPGLDSKGDDTQ